MLKEVAGLKYLASPKLSDLTGMTHGFLTRRGGVSTAPFATLNFDTRTGDTEENVEENTARAASAVGFDAATLSLPLQVHGTNATIADQPAGYMLVEADAIATAVPGLAVGVLTADCLPILLYDAQRRVAAAVHAGWRGAAAGVAWDAVEAMRERFGSRTADIVAALGPHIRPCCYTVGAEVRTSFTETFGARWAGLGAFAETKGVITLDLALAARHALIGAGLDANNIDESPALDWCTSCRTDLFFSHRREVGSAGGGEKTGRQLSVIMLRSE